MVPGHGNRSRAATTEQIRSMPGAIDGAVIPIPMAVLVLVSGYETTTIHLQCRLYPLFGNIHG